MKLVRENLNTEYLSRFIEDSDPIKDMGIGAEPLIKAWLKKMNIYKCTLTTKLTINTYDSVDISNVDINAFPDFIKFNHIVGGFHCEHSKLISLKGCPKSISGSFLVRYNKLKTLKYSPSVIRGIYSVSYNEIEDIRDLYNVSILDALYLSHNNLEILEGVPDYVNGNFYIHDNPLKTLQYFPDEVTGDISFSPSKYISIEKIKQRCNVLGNIIEYNK